MPLWRTLPRPVTAATSRPDRTLMHLVSPDGVLVGVSRDKGERLKSTGGYREPQSQATEAPASPAPKRRGRPPKTASTEEPENEL